ncbi:MAG: hypothetical protein M3Y72_11635, partial [Acidobacteriota bacterium]|nr:hypothetical protein [Acidobacteriota bacterium]
HRAHEGDELPGVNEVGVTGPERRLQREVSASVHDRGVTNLLRSAEGMEAGRDEASKLQGRV